MLKSYLKIALRTIWRHKGYSLLNIAGLALGMACALFILLWVQDELSFDRFHAGAGTLFRVEQEQKGGQGIFHVNVTPYGLRDALVADIPEIRDAARSARPGTLLVRRGEKAFYESRVAAVDPSFLRMFTFPVVRGDAATALTGPDAMAMTETMARKYFGAEDPIGQSLVINNRYPVTIKAVLKNVPANSTLQFDGLLSMAFLKSTGVDVDDWNSNQIVTYVQLHKESEVAAADRKITRLVYDRTLASYRGSAENWARIQADPAQLKRYNEYVGPDYMIKPVVDLRLFAFFGFDRKPQGLQTIRTFAAIGLFVLLIACINFMNLATARSANRAREVGLRKVVGADRRRIAVQFYGESILTALLAGLASFAVVVILRPGFNAIAGKTLTLAALFSPKFVLGSLAVMLLTGLVAGSYPALLLSSFQPIKVLRGRAKDGARGALLRKLLVVVQFGLSITLLVCMAVASRQIDFMRSKKLGYDKDQLVYMPLRGEARQSYAVLKERLSRDPNVLGVTGTSQPPTAIGANSWGADWEGRDPGQKYLIGCESVDFDYPETMKIEMAAGRPFDRLHPTDADRAFLVNEAVTKLMGLDAAAAVGKSFRFQGVDGAIVGVMKDFHYQSVHTSIEPLALTMATTDPAKEGNPVSFAVIRLRAGDTPGALASVETAWRGVNGAYPFEYRFFDQDFDQMYRSDERMGAILKIFSFLAVAIACLGLFGLASFTAEQRTKEIGVRKVLGASSAGIVTLLSKEFSKWVLLANALAWPAAYLVTRSWLAGFAYRTSVAWWLFAAAGAGAFAVALLTVGFQAVRAAQSNPVDCLKYE